MNNYGQRKCCEGFRVRVCPGCRCNKKHASPPPSLSRVDDRNKETENDGRSILRLFER